MKDPVIAADAAAEMLAAWVEEIGATLSDDSRKRLTTAIMAGRLDYAEGKFVYDLIAPVELENGARVTSLTVEEPTAAQMKDASKGGKGDETEITFRLLSSLSHQPVAVIDRLKQRDILALSELIAFFA